jgi:hypothetical protein
MSKGVGAPQSGATAAGAAVATAEGTKDRSARATTPIANRSLLLAAPTGDADASTDKIGVQSMT